MTSTTQGPKKTTFVVHVHYTANHTWQGLCSGDDPHRKNADLSEPSRRCLKLLWTST